MDRLFTFFQRELSPRNAELRDTQRQLVNGYVASLDAMRKASKNELVNEREPLQTAILRTVLIYQLSQIPTTLDNIQFGLYALTSAKKKTIDTNLKLLAKAGAVFFRQQSKTYELAVGSGVDPYDLISRYLEDTSKHPEDMVEAFLSEVKSPAFLHAKQYNLVYGEDKRFRTVYVRAKDIGEKLWEELKKEQLDAASKPNQQLRGRCCLCTL